MQTALVVAASLLGTALVLLVVRQLVQGHRARGRREIEQRFGGDVLLAETLAPSFGEQSRGATQARVGGGEDAIAWRLPDPRAWREKLESLRGAR